MPKKYSFFSTAENPQQNCTLLLLPYELQKLIFEFFDVDCSQDLAHFALTSQKSRRVSQERLEELFNKFTLKSISAPVLGSLLSRTQISEEKFAKTTLKLLREQPDAFEKTKNALESATQLYPELIKLEHENANPGYCIDTTPIRLRDKVLFPFAVVLILIAVGAITWGFAKQDHKPALGYSVGALFLLSFAIVTGRALRGLWLTHALSNTQEKLIAQLDLGFSANSNEKITDEYSPQLDIQYDGDDLESALPSDGATEISPLLLNRVK